MYLRVCMLHLDICVRVCVCEHSYYCTSIQSHLVHAINAYQCVDYIIIYILSWCYSFHPCHPFAGHAGLFAGHDTHGTQIGHLSLKSSKVRSLLALSVTMRRSIFGLLWFLESGHSTQTISNPVGISWHLTCTAVRCVLIVSCRQRIWQETCLCTQIGAPSGWFLTIFGSICLENWLNYVELVCEELSEIVGCFSYVMLYMCKKLAWAFAQLAAFDRKPLDAYPVLDWPLIRCTGHRPSCWYRQSLPLVRDRMSNLRI